MAYQFINKIDKYSDTIINHTKNHNNIPIFNSLNKEYFNTDIDVTLENLSIDETYLKIKESLDNSFITISTEGLKEIKDWIVNFIKKIINNIKKVFNYVVQFFKKIYNYIKKIFGFGSKDSELDVNTEKKAEMLYLDQDAGIKHELDRAAETIYNQIKQLPKKELITKDELKSLVKFNSQFTTNIIQFLDDIWNEREPGLNYANKSILKWMIERDKINLEGLPDWLQEQLLNGNGYDSTLKCPERTLEEYLSDDKSLSNNIFNSEYSGKNILNKYFTFGDLLNEKIKQDFDTFEFTLHSLQNTANICERKINALNNGAQNKKQFNNGQIYILFQLSRLITVSSTNLIVVFNKIFKIFESNLKDSIDDIKTRIKLGDTPSNIDDYEIIRNLKPISYVENIPVYTKNQICKAFNAQNNSNNNPYHAGISSSVNTTFVYITVSDNIRSLPEDIQTFILYHEFGHYINHHGYDKIVLQQKESAKYSDMFTGPNMSRIIRWKDHYRPLKDELQADIVGAEHSSPETGLKFCEGVIKYHNLNINDYRTGDNIIRQENGTNMLIFPKRRDQDIFARLEFFKKWVKSGEQPNINSNWKKETD